MINPSAAHGAGRKFPGQSFACILEACKAHGVGTMGIRVFAAGILATDVRHGREIIITDDTDVASEENRARASLLRLGMSASGDTPYGTRAETSLRYVLGEPMIDCAIVGLAKLDHLRQVLKASALGPLPSDAMALIN